MKKISKFLLLPIVMLCFAFTTSSNSVTNELKQPKDVEEFIETEEGIYCKKEKRNTDGSTDIRSCWFCNCSEL